MAPAGSVPGDQMSSTAIKNIWPINSHSLGDGAINKRQTAQCGGYIEDWPMSAVPDS
jgi:hypothetical protein